MKRPTVKAVNKIYKVLDADRCYGGNKRGKRIEDTEGGSYNFKYGNQEILDREGDISKDLKEGIQLTVWLLGARVFQVEEYKV